MSCPSLAQLSSTLFSNVCLFTGVSTNLPVLSALKTCCGASNVVTTADGCATYCNITVPWDEEYFSICVFDNLESSVITTLDGGCRNHFDPEETEFPPAAIATTWTVSPKTLTMSTGGSAVKTVTIGTALPTFSLATSTSASSAASTPATSSSAASSPPSGTTSCSTTATPVKSSGGTLTSATGLPTLSLKPSASGNATVPKPSPTPVPTIKPTAAASEVRISNFGVGAMAALVLFGLML